MILSNSDIDENHQKTLTTLFCVAIISRWKYSTETIQMVLQEEFRHYSPDLLKQLMECYCEDKPVEIKKQLIDLINKCTS